MKTFFTLVLALMVGFVANAQSDSMLLQGYDSMFVELTPVTVITKKFANNKEKSDFNKLKRNVTKVYPYAKMAGEIYKDMVAEIDGMDKRREKKKYKKNQERDLRAEFEDSIKNLTVTQGKILVMLINRETGNNCYALIKDLKNPVTAMFYQIMAKKYDYDLKAEYVPANNPDIELIIDAIEHGYVIK
ncbi:MAG: DUF4294 domain-containing protein [Chitinophagales bacterium]|nr:DUF4294 domain-containing protein [Chitinophagales bacterium]